jgi:hypothetical protein
MLANYHKIHLCIRNDMRRFGYCIDRRFDTDPMCSNQWLPHNRALD